MTRSTYNLGIVVGNVKLPEIDLLSLGGYLGSQCQTVKDGSLGGNIGTTLNILLRIKIVFFFSLDEFFIDLLGVH